MHEIQFREIMWDAEVPRAIGPVVLKHLLSLADTTEVLKTCEVPRAANVAQLAIDSSFAVSSSTRKGLSVFMKSRL
jgi:hypothetical protein